MIPSPLSLDLNQDHHYHDFSTPNHHTSSFSSLQLVPPNQYCDLPNYIQEVEKMTPSTTEKHDSRSMKQKLTIRWKKEESDEMNNNNNNNIEASESADSKMVDCDDVPNRYNNKIEDNKKQLAESPVGTDNSSSSNSNSNSNYSTTPTVRVCSDCNTTKTPLWRSGPKGPKTLCNACGIRQRKARRAMAAAAAASANGVMTVDKTSSVKPNKLQKKVNKSKIHHSSKVPHMKKKRKVETKPSQTRNNFSFEDFTLMLSNNLSVQQVFPQDEKEAAILLMALSYGLVHG